MSDFLEKYDQLKNIGRLHMQGRSAREIGDELDLSTHAVNKEIKQWKELNSRMMRESGTFAEQMTDIVAEIDQHWKMLTRELWDVLNDAKVDEDRKSFFAATKQIADIETNRAKIFGNAAAQQDIELIAELEETRWKVEQVQKVLRSIAESHPQVAQEIYEALANISNQANPVAVHEPEEIEANIK